MLCTTQSFYVFERKPYRAQRSTSDINGIDPQIHNGTAKGVMAGLRNILRQPGDVTTVPEMLASYRAVRRQLPRLRLNAGEKSLFEASVFHDLMLAASAESERLIKEKSCLCYSSASRTLAGTLGTKLNGDSWSNAFRRQRQRRLLGKL
jgi:hypothetical protein